MLGILLVLLWPGIALAAEARIGAYVTGLRDINIRENSFNADIWLWAISPPEAGSPLKTMEFTNAKQVKLAFESAQPVDGKVWHQVKVSGSFHQRWDLHQYPFDKQQLRINIEEALADEDALTYAVDSENSSINQLMKVAGWAVVDFKISGGPVSHQSTFGDPRLKPGANSKYAGLTLEITLARQEVISFLLLTMPVYVAVLVSFLTSAIRLQNASMNSPRYSLLAGSLFLIIINLRAANDQIDATGGIGLIPGIHMLAMVCVLLITCAAIWGQRRLERGVATVVIDSDNFRTTVLLGTLFALSNAAMIAAAYAL
jgi:hypothetical protein